MNWRMWCSRERDRRCCGGREGSGAGGATITRMSASRSPTRSGSVAGRKPSNSAKKNEYRSSSPCEWICSLPNVDCDPKEVETQCVGEWKPANPEGEFKGQCCRGVERTENCCPPSRIALLDHRCCGPEEIVLDQRCEKQCEVKPVISGEFKGQYCIGVESSENCCPPSRFAQLDCRCCVGDEMVVRQHCVKSPVPPPVPDPLHFGWPPFEILWTDEIHFAQDQPGRGGGSPLTPQGTKELGSVLSWLRRSPDLRIRLIGGASWEGPEIGREEYNQALATRRVEFVVKALGDFATALSDPIPSDDAERGCENIGVGLWSCGATGAPPNTARPEDRVVRVTFLRLRGYGPSLRRPFHSL